MPGLEDPNKGIFRQAIAVALRNGKDCKADYKYRPTSHGILCCCDTYLMWHHAINTLSALLALYEENPPSLVPALSQRSIKVELWWCSPEQTIQLPIFWDAMLPRWHYCKDLHGLIDLRITHNPPRNLYQLADCWTSGWLSSFVHRLLYIWESDFTVVK